MPAINIHDSAKHPAYQRAREQRERGEEGRESASHFTLHMVRAALPQSASLADSRRYPRRDANSWEERRLAGEFNQIFNHYESFSSSPVLRARRVMASGGDFNGRRRLTQLAKQKGLLRGQEAPGDWRPTATLSIAKTGARPGLRSHGCSRAGGLRPGQASQASRARRWQSLHMQGGTPPAGQRVCMSQIR